MGSPMNTKECGERDRLKEKFARATVNACVAVEATKLVSTGKVSRFLQSLKDYGEAWRVKESCSWTLLSHRKEHGC